MALHLLRRVTHAGMDELANWTAKTFKFSFHNNSSGAVRILVEEDPDGMAELEQWKIGDGIPTVGKAGERHRQKMLALKKSINASKPYQEFTLIRDQTKTINMRSPVVKCSLALAEWNGALKITEIQRRLTEGNTFTVHPGYDRAPGVCSVRADSLEHALLAAGVTLGFLIDDEAPKGAAGAAVPAPGAASFSAPAQPSAQLGRPPSEPPPLPPPATAPEPSAPCAPCVPATAAARPPAPRPRPTSDLGSRALAASPPEPMPSAEKGLAFGFLPMTGEIRLLRGEEWVPAHFVGLSLGGLVSAAAGAVCVEFATTSGMTQEVILPEQIPKLILPAGAG